MERIEISRDEFAERFGFTPSPDVVSMLFAGPDGQVHSEYIFTDFPVQDAGVLRDIAELERILSLPCPQF